MIEDITIIKSQLKTQNILNLYDRAAVSISGGSDSDDMLDLISRLELTCELHYIFFDTGLEYKATHEHLDELEVKYNIIIKRIKARTPIPTRS